MRSIELLTSAPSPLPYVRAPSCIVKAPHPLKCVFTQLHSSTGVTGGARGDNVTTAFAMTVEQCGEWSPPPGVAVAMTSVGTMAPKLKLRVASTCATTVVRGGGPLRPLALDHRRVERWCSYDRADAVREKHGRPLSSAPAHQTRPPRAA
jgi:hypothetical protein